MNGEQDLLKYVYLARHGETDWNREKRFQGSNDIPLNNRGRKQAIALGKTMSHNDVSAIYSSPKSRAVETAEIVNKELKTKLEIVPDLREISHGVYDGLTMDEINSRHSDSIEKWRADRINIAPPEGESIRQCCERVIPVFESLVETTGDNPIMIISHMIVTKSILLHLIGAPLESFWRFGQGSAALNIIKYIDDNPVVELLNYTEPIGGM